MSKPKAFYSYMENEEKLNMLSDEQAGRLYKSLYAYSRTGVKPDLSDDPLLAYAFMDFVIDIDRDREKYEQTCQRRSEAGRKGGQAKATNEQAKEANAKTDVAKEANANFAKDKKAKCSKRSETEAEAEAEAEAEINNIYTSVVEDFNFICKSLPSVTVVNSTRRGRIDRARKRLNKSNTTFEGLFRRVEASDFLSGRVDSWRANFDWILKPDSLTKILEGAYDNRAAPNKRGSVYDAGSANFNVREIESSSLFND